jgi:nucleotide-binding universal stress UspA family protein
MKNILVALDFDQREDKLIGYAEKLAWDYDAKVWLVHCAAPDPEFVSMKASSNYERDARAAQLRDEHKHLHTMAHEMEARGIDVEPLLIQGPTVATLLEKASDIAADLIITGLHEHGFLYNAMVGNTSLQLVKRTDIPVLTIPVDK